jgi:hypothetical protein
MKDIRNIDPILVTNLKLAKEKLALAQRDVEAAESAIYIAAGDLPEKGTVHYTGVKISLGYYRKWSKEKLDEIEKIWAQKSNLPFPFKREWKEDGKAVSAIEQAAPETFKLLEEALTLIPKKPSFELTKEEE